MTEPTVAVIIPAFRADDSLSAALRSLIAQSVTAWEAVVVCDDGRDPHVVVARTGLADPRIRAARTPGIGLGPSAARNVGLAVTTAPLVAPLDADDRFRADRLARLIPLALVRGAVADNVAVVRDGDGTPLGRLFPPEAVPAELDGSGFLATSVPLFPVFRREVAVGWDEGLRFAEDVAFNLRLLDRLGSIPIDPAPLYQYRVRPGSLSAAPDSAGAAELAYTAMLADVGLRSRYRNGLEAKRTLNRAFAASGHANFQEFLSTRRP